MKKILLTAAIVISAAISHGATVSWTMTKVQQDGTGVNGVMYVFADSVVSRDSVLALAGTGADAVNSFFASATSKATWTVTAGTGTMATYHTAKPTNESLGINDSTAYDFFAVVFNTETITDESDFYVTALKENVMTASGSSNKVIGFGTQATASNATGAWNAVAVPEPTSGLLMLVGLAGLALRRRRA